jgi:hypothetical protein
MKTMKKLLAVLLLAFPATTMADYLDVIEFKMDESCSFDAYLAIVKDFNEWGKDFGYKAEIWSPLMRGTLDTMFWVGRTKDAETFGHAWDTWRDAQSNPESAAAKLGERMSRCEMNLNRSGFDTYK